MKKKIVAAALAAVLLVGVSVAGTLAWLVDSTDSVTNTFTYGNINIDLTETDTNLDEDNNPATNSYELIPGETTAKDPTVTVEAGSEACWLFVKIEELYNDAGDSQKYIQYSMADGWNALTGYTGVYWRTVSAIAENADDASYPVLLNNQVTANGEKVTKAYVDSVEAGTVNEPQLIFTAAAVQSDNLKDAQGAAVTTAAGAAAFLPTGFLPVATPTT